MTLKWYKSSWAWLCVRLKQLVMTYTERSQEHSACLGECLVLAEACRAALVYANALAGAHKRVVIVKDMGSSTLPQVKIDHPWSYFSSQIMSQAANWLWEPYNHPGRQIRVPAASLAAG